MSVEPTARVRAEVNGGLSPDELEQLSDVQAAFREPTEDRAGLLRRVNNWLDAPEGKRIVDVLELGDADSEPEYDLVFEHGGRAAVGGAKKVLDPRHVEALLLPVWKTDIPRRGPSDHRPIGFALIQASRPVDAIGSQSDETSEWIASFMHTMEGFPTAVDLDDSSRMYRILEGGGWDIFRGTDERLYVRPPVLLRYVTKDIGQRTTAGDLKRRLVRLGFKRPRNREGKLAARSADDKRTASRRFMASPPRFDPR